MSRMPALVGAALTLAATLTAATAVTAATAAEDSPPLTTQIVISHRGASDYRPEHTFPAYDLAMAMDTDMLECDLQITADEVLVCIHDETIDRTSDGTGRVDAYTLAELREFDFGGWFGDGTWAGASVVPFEEQLDCYLRHNGRMRFHVETKGPASYGGRMEQLLVELLDRKGLGDTGDVDTSTVLVQSFEPESLSLVKQANPALPTAFLTYVPDPATTIALYEAGQIDAVAPNVMGLLFPGGGEQAIEQIHAAGIPIHTWTVNTRADMEALVDLGVDGIFTNTPDVLREVIDQAGVPISPQARGNPTDFEHGCPGVAGRVTSADGPGDVWQPAEGDRGVELATAAEPAPDQPTPTDDPDQPDPSATEDELPVTGGGTAAVAVGLAALATASRRRRTSAC